ncbi:MAG TPA: hypothetical protein VFX15_03380 [Actinomycetes bacterium]|nr:hypothetical protein [Actinomycetes bacterium]
MRRGLALAALSAVGTYAALQILGRRAGSTARERQARLPGDEQVARPQIVTNHATTIRALPEAVWPWLSQLGWHLGGYYTPHWVDALLFPENWRSLDHLDPNLIRDLSVGDVIPDGKPGTAHYVVAQVEAPLLLVLASSTHLPRGWSERYGARMTWTWCFALSDLGDGTTRVHLRVRGRTDPWWLTALYVGGIVPADYIMATGMLRGLKARAEGRSSPKVSGREAVRQDLYQ